MRGDLSPLGLSPAVAYSVFFCISVSFYTLSIAFLPLHWHGIGFSKFEIALVSSGENLASLFGPLIAALLVGHLLSTRTLALGAGGAAVMLFAPLLFVTCFPVVAVLWFLCLCCNRGLLTVVFAAAVRDSADGSLNYGRIRLWGSIGFIAVLYALGVGVDGFGTGLIPGATLGVLLLTGLGVFVVLDKLDARSTRLSGAAVLRDALRQGLRPNIWALLLVSALHWASQSVFYTYFSLYLSDLGWSASMIAVPFILGVLAEIALFFGFDWVERRFSLIAVLRLSVALTCLRWLLYGVSTSPSLILAASLLHAFTYAGFHAASVKLVFVMLPRSRKDLGQALLTAAGNGVGAFVGRIGAGIGAQWCTTFGGYRGLFIASAIVSMLAWFICFFIYEKPQEDKGQTEVV